MHDAAPASPGNIAMHIARMAEHQPAHPAVVCANGRNARGEIAYEQLTFAELEAIGWIGAKRPRMVAVQSEGCAPIVRD